VLGYYLESGHGRERVNSELFRPHETLPALAELRSEKPIKIVAKLGSWNRHRRALSIADGTPPPLSPGRGIQLPKL
jgi:hypothetical protein